MRHIRTVLAGVVVAWLAFGPNLALDASKGESGKIAFEGDRFGGWGIAAMKPDGSGIASLNSPFGAADASWSPNGKRVAFEADPVGDGNLEVFVMNADGTGLRQLTDSPGRDFWPDWFPNGHQIAFTSDRTGAPNIYVMNADGSDQRALTDESVAASMEPDVSSNSNARSSTAARTPSRLNATASSPRWMRLCCVSSPRSPLRSTVRPPAQS